MALILGLPLSVSANVLQFVRDLGDPEPGKCWEWSGDLNKWGPYHRLQVGKQFVYLTPRVCVFEVAINCNLLKGYTLSPKEKCKNKLCCRPDHMTIVPYSSQYVRMHRSETGETLGEFLTHREGRLVKIQATAHKATGMENVSRCLLQGDMSAVEIADKFSVPVATVKRTAAALRVDWF